MILTGPEICRIVTATRDRKSLAAGGVSVGESLPWIDVEPWNPECAGPNSLDVTLGPTLLAYDFSGALDPEVPQKTFEVEPWPERDGRVSWMLHPGTLYLGATAERVELHGVAAMLTGRSSLGRLGVDCHVSAGLIDDGFAGNITLEIRVVHPVILRPGMRFAQLVFEPVRGVRSPYRGRYQGDSGPVASRFHADGGR